MWWKTKFYKKSNKPYFCVFLCFLFFSLFRFFSWFLYILLLVFQHFTFLDDHFTEVLITRVIPYAVTRWKVEIVDLSTRILTEKRTDKTSLSEFWPSQAIEWKKRNYNIIMCKLETRALLKKPTKNTNSSWLSLQLFHQISSTMRNEDLIREKRLDFISGKKFGQGKNYSRQEILVTFSRSIFQNCTFTRLKFRN